MERNVSEPKIEVSSHVNKGTQLYHIDVALHDLVTHHGINRYLSEMLTRVIRTALMERYADIQAIVDEVLLSQETKGLIKDAIRKEVERLVNQSIKEMFEGK